MIKPYLRPLIIAHRGASKYAPENTLPSFEMALQYNPELVELDYHMSCDGKFVVIHDEYLDRTTDAAEKWKTSFVAVKDRTLEEIKTLDAGSWFNDGAMEFCGTKVPTLKEALDIIQVTSATLIERKEGSAKDIVRFLEKEGWISRIILHSFDWDFVEEIRSLTRVETGAGGPPTLYKGKLLTKERQFLNTEFVKDIKRRGARFIIWDEKVTEKSISYAHKRNLRVFIYTINDPDEAEHFIKLGVDGIITDDPEMIAKRLRK